jgi:hypothetical protein
MGNHFKLVRDGFPIEDDAVVGAQVARSGNPRALCSLPACIVVFDETGNEEPVTIWSVKDDPVTRGLGDDCTTKLVGPYEGLSVKGKVVELGMSSEQEALFAFTRKERIRGVKVPEIDPVKVAKDKIGQDLFDRWEGLAQALNTERERVKPDSEYEQSLCDDLWVILQDVLGIPEDLCTPSFSKGEADKMVEEIFGTMDNPGRGPHDKLSAAKTFSLYLARKCLVVNKAEDLKASMSSFLELVTSDPPTTELTDRSVHFIEAVSRHLFSDKAWRRFCDDDQSWRPTQRAACVETKVKRDAFYQRTEVASQPGRVIPKAILSGGKIRVITLDSFENMRFSPVNTFMSRCIRTQQWSVFGRTVEEWIGSSSFREWSGMVCSGDLKSATDTFSGELAERVFEVLRERLSLTDDDVDAMRACTTRAFLETKRGEGVQQTRGQLMGSILSFPILCLVSLTAWAVGTGFDQQFVWAGTAAQRQSLLDEIPVGINGDDIVFGTDDDGRGWERGVASVGGIVSAGKSLLGDHSFTLNSELWLRDDVDADWFDSHAIRPSLLLGIMDGRRACPEQLWDSWSKNEIIDDEGLQDLIAARLKVGLPPSMGGLGGEPRYIRSAVQDWADEHVCRGKPSVRPEAYWTPAQLEQKELDRKGTRVCIPREKLGELNKELRKPYRGTVEWTVPGRAKIIASGLTDNILRELHLREMQKYQEDVVEVFVPRRCWDLAKELGGYVLEHVGIDEEVASVETPEEEEWRLLKERVEEARVSRRALRRLRRCKVELEDAIMGDETPAQAMERLATSIGLEDTKQPVRAVGKLKPIRLWCAERYLGGVLDRAWGGLHGLSGEDIIDRRPE